MAITLVNLLGQYIPIQDLVLRQLEIKDVISLTKVAMFRNFTKTVEKTQFNINKVLRPFFNPIAFRRVQAKHNVLIMDDFAFSFMERIDVIYQDPDRVLRFLAVQKGRHARILSRFLISNERYKDVTAEYHKNASKWFRRQGSGKSVLIQVLVTARTPLLSAFHTDLTHSANIIAWNKAYGIFGYPTFVERASYLLKHIENVKELGDWYKFGVRISPCSLQDAQPQTCTQGSKLRLTGTRRVGDARSWIIPLNVSSIQASPFPDHLIEYASFSVEVARESYGHYEVQAQALESPALEYQYILSDALSATKRFTDLTVTGLHLLASEHQPPRMNELFERYNMVRARREGAPFSKPHMELLKKWKPPVREWEYHDDEMVKILKAKFPEFAAELAAGLADMRSRRRKRKREYGEAEADD